MAVTAVPGDPIFVVAVPTTAPERSTRTVQENGPVAEYTVKLTCSAGRAPACAVEGRTPAVTDVTRASSDVEAPVEGAADGDVDPQPTTAIPATNTPARTATLVLMSTS
jgi:hypothetical protein